MLKGEIESYFNVQRTVTTGPATLNSTPEYQPYLPCNPHINSSAWTASSRRLKDRFAICAHASAGQAVESGLQEIRR